jgi:hypothetical protein
MSVADEVNAVSGPLQDEFTHALVDLIIFRHKDARY